MLNKEQQAMVEANIGLVKFTINKYLKSMAMEYDDMVSVGYVALCKAAEKYNPDKDKTFSTYAVKVIIHNMHREILPYTRKKRGVGCVTVSLDELLNSKHSSPSGSYENYRGRQLLGYEPDFSDEVIDKVLCEPVWKLCPTHKLLYNSSLSTKEIGKLEGVTASAILTRRRKEFKKAKRYLNRIGIYDAV